MKVFVTGGSGYIGSETIPLLLTAGHEIVALSRSEELAAKLKNLSEKIEIVQGDLENPELLAKLASEADAVVHLGFIHDFTNFGKSLEVDLAAIKAMGSALKGTNKPFVGTSGMTASENSGALDESKRSTDETKPRVAAENAVLSLADEGVRSSVIRLPFTVHGAGKSGFIPFYVDASKKNGFAAYIDEGDNHWPAVNLKDAAELYKLVLENGKPGSVYHAVGEEGIPFKDIAETTARGLGVSTRSILKEEAGKYYQWLAFFLARNVKVYSNATQRELGWTPKHGGLFEDITEHYVK